MTESGGNKLIQNIIKRSENASLFARVSHIAIGNTPTLKNCQAMSPMLHNGPQSIALFSLSPAHILFLLQDLFVLAAISVFALIFALTLSFSNFYPVALCQDSCIYCSESGNGSCSTMHELTGQRCAPIRPISIVARRCDVCRAHSSIKQWPPTSVADH